MRYVVASCAIAILCLTALMRAAVQSPTPRFNAAINFVEVPVRVVDGQGRVVSRLTLKDFEVSESGEVQQLVMADEVVDGHAPRPVSGHDLGTVTLPVGSVQPGLRPPSRVFFLVVDDNHLSSEVSAKTASTLRRFVDDQLNQSDLVAVAYTSGVLGQEITADRDAVRSALGRLHGHYDSLNSGQMQEHTARVALGVVSSSVGALASFPTEGPANLVLVTSGVGCVESRRADTGAAYCGSELTDAVKAAVKTGVTVYSIDPAGLTVPSLQSPATVKNGNAPDSPGGSWGLRGALINSYQQPKGSNNIFDAMRALANDTGGFSIVNTERVSEGLDRVLRETNHYYHLGYYSNHTETPEKIGTSISVRVKRHDVRTFHASQRPRLVNPAN